MTLKEIISNIDAHNEEAIIFAKKVNEKFLPSSEAVLVELDEEELGEPTRETAEKHCPGFDYFLEVFIVKEVIEDVNATVGFKSPEQKVESIIHYAEFDA